MNLLFFLAMQGFTVVYPDPVQPNQYIVWPAEEMATQSPISQETQLLDAARVGNPTLNQRGPYQFPDDTSYPLRTVIPRNERQTVPMEEQLAMQDYQLQTAQRQAAVSGAQLQQYVTKQNYDYDRNVNDQALVATKALSTLDPGSPDFPVQVGQLQQTYPLAFQNPAFQTSLGRLNQTFNQQMEGKQLLDRMRATSEEQEAKYRERMGIEMRQNAAKYGDDILSEYDRLSQETGDPIKAYGNLAPKIAARQLASERIKTEQELDVKERRPITPSERRSLISSREAIIQRMQKDEAQPGDEVILKDLNDQLGIPQEAVAPTPQNRKPLNAIFK